MNKVCCFSSSSSTHFSSNVVRYEGYIFIIFILAFFSIMSIYVIHLVRTLIYTRSSLLKMEKAQEKLLMNIPRRAVHWCLEEVKEEHPPFAFLIYLCYIPSVYYVYGIIDYFNQITII